MKEKLVSLAAALAVFAVAPTVFAAWAGPALPPPGGNTPAPLNVGTSPQIKDGWIGLFGDAAGLTVSKLTSYAKPSSLLVGVKGGVGADKFCNSSGTVCGTIDELLGGASNSTTTVSRGGCSYQTKTFTRNINIAAGNDKAAVIDLLNTIAGGTYTVSGSGKSVKCGGSNCGNHGTSIKVSDGGAFGKTATTLQVWNGKAGKAWSVPETTFTTEAEEKIRATVYQGSMTGSLTITGPRLVCDPVASYRAPEPQRAPL